MMTTDLEKQFFDTFGIEASYHRYLLIDLTTRNKNEKFLFKDDFIQFVKSGKDYLLLKVVKYYPQITDRILLELICILTEWRQYCESAYVIKAINIDTLKEDILKDCLYMSNWYEFKKCGKDIKHQVQELFKGE